MSMPNPLTLPLTRVMKSPIIDRSGEVLGCVDDLIVRLGGRGYPPVTGLRCQVGRRQVFVPIEQIAELTVARVQLAGQTLNLGRFERREGEVLLHHDILAHKLINVEAGRLVRATNIVLALKDGVWRVVGIDTSPRRGLPRVFGRASDRVIEQSAILDWARVEPFVGHVPTAKLRLPLPRLKRLHPAQIADLVEAASHDEGEEIITAVHGDLELEADVFEELDTKHQIEFLRSRSDVEAAEVLGSMAPDDAADLIGAVDQRRRAPILARLPARQHAKVQALLAYNPGTAGGLMTPDFVAVGRETAVAEVLERIRDAPIAATAIYVLDRESCLLGSASVQDVLRAPLGSPSGACLEVMTARVGVEADFTDVARLMADYNLTALPVVDDANHLVGSISVDDVLEVLIPDDWRRRTEGNAG